MAEKFIGGIAFEGLDGLVFGEKAEDGPPSLALALADERRDFARDATGRLLVVLENGKGDMLVAVWRKDVLADHRGRGEEKLADLAVDDFAIRRF